MQFLHKWLPITIVALLGLGLGIIIKPDSLNKYVGHLVGDDSQVLADGQKVFFTDVNSDGNSEEFIYYHLSDNRQPVINQYSSKGEFQNVWYLEGEVVSYFDFISGDYNNDGQKEVYVFSKDNESLYLYGLLANNSNLFNPKKVTICQFPNSNLGQQVTINPGKLTDLNGDGLAEIIFSVNSRYSTSPRRVFAYDIAHDTLYASPEIEMQLVGTPIIQDIDGDNRPEVFLATFNSTNQTWTTNNNNNPINSASLVLNHDLSYKFAPFLFKTRMSVTASFPVYDGTKWQIASASWMLNQSKPGTLSLLSNNGEVIKQIALPPKNFVFDTRRTNYDNIWLFSRDGMVLKYSANLGLLMSEQIGAEVNQVSFTDIDGNNSEEILVVRHNFLHVFDYEFRHPPAKVEIPGLGLQKVYFSINQQKNDRNLLSVQNDNYLYMVNYFKQPQHWLVYLVYLFCSASAVFIYLLVNKLTILRIEAIRNQARENMQLQLDLIRNQLDPHFLFNALNSISFSINNDDRKTAYNNLGVFSKLMRETIVSIDDSTRTLEDEIAYVKNYFLLEKFRFKEMFNYDFIISPGVNKSIKIPKMSLFCYVEGALKKGVLPQGKPGEIVITIDTSKGKGLAIMVKDTGMFRDLSNPANHTKGMVIMDRLFAYFNASNAIKIEVNLKDLGTPEQPLGSIAELIFPADYYYESF